MNWNLEGKRITANYMGVRVAGTVSDSRVKYGGKVQYTVELDEPVQWRWWSEPTSRVLVDSDELIVD